MLMIVVLVPVGSEATEAKVQRVVSLSVAIEECISAKARANRRPRYVSRLRAYLQLFARGREDLPISAIDSEDLEGWFASRRECPVTRASNLGCLSALFTYAKRRGWAHENPCDRVERVTVEAKAPEIMSVSDVRRMLDYARAEIPSMLSHLVLGVFAGIRPEEISHITWPDIDLPRQTVTLNHTKNRARRMARLEPNAVGWLKASQSKLDHSLATIKRARRKIRAALSLAWPQDVLRHTAATHLLQLHGDENKVAQWLGNSPRMIHRHYKGLVTPEQTAEFWTIFPR